MTLTEILDVQPFHPVYQPIVRLANGRPLGFEALTRFRVDPCEDSGFWFQQAALHGQTTSIEHSVLRRALPEIHNLPEGHFLSINLSPSTILNGSLIPLLAELPMDQLVIEITEHESVTDYEALCQALSPLREAGLRIAIDDLGAGFSSLRHVLRLAPEMIKLDSHMVRRVDSNPRAASMVSALTEFCGNTDSLIIAEGIETRDELRTLTHLGVHAGQGYYLGEPEPELGESFTSDSSLADYNRSRKLTSPRWLW